MLLPTGSGMGRVENGMEALVLELQASGEPSDSSFARLATPLPRLTSFTLCYMIKVNRFREESTFLSYAISDDRDNEFRIGEYSICEIYSTDYRVFFGTTLYNHTYTV